MFMNKKQNNDNNIVYYIIIAIIFGFLGFFIGQSYSSSNMVDNQKQQVVEEQKNKDISIKIIEDKRCKDQLCMNMDQVINQLKKIPAIKNAKIEIEDFSDKNAKDFVEKNKIDKLPVIIFNSSRVDPTIDAFLKKLNDKYYYLEIWAQFDPMAEICDNWIDDNWDWKIDCEDSKCAKQFVCAPKVDKPKAELFVMSHCPFGTQAQKWYLEVMKKLGKVADVKVRFVDYLMHGKEEWEDNLIEYCIQKDQNDKFYDYLKCFLKAWDRDNCLKETKINKQKLDSCIKETKEKINYDKNLADKTRRFPKFELETQENQKYWVQWSPTFVLNWYKIDRVGRSAKAYADLICSSFKNKPEECKQDFSDVTYDPNFGFTSNWQNVWGWCGQ